MSEEINWKIILDSLAQLIAEHGKRLKALESVLNEIINVLYKQTLIDGYQLQKWQKQLKGKKLDREGIKTIMEALKDESIKKLEGED